VAAICVRRLRALTLWAGVAAEEAALAAAFGTKWDAYAAATPLAVPRALCGGGARDAPPSPSGHARPGEASGAGMPALDLRSAVALLDGGAARAAAAGSKAERAPLL
jgi:hypothetical protein